MLYMDQLFQIFVDEESEQKDIVIKMFHSSVDEERFLCVDLSEAAVDFLEPTEYPPTHFILNVPTVMIKASSMEILSINRHSKELISGHNSLRNST